MNLWKDAKKEEKLRNASKSKVILCFFFSLKEVLEIGMTKYKKVNGMLLLMAFQENLSSVIFKICNCRHFTISWVPRTSVEWIQLSSTCLFNLIEISSDALLNEFLLQRYSKIFSVEIFIISITKRHWSSVFCPSSFSSSDRLTFQRQILLQYCSPNLNLWEHPFLTPLLSTFLHLSADEVAEIC